jgi:ABC-type branched-subunit amino acid transport system permease subunit
MRAPGRPSGVPGWRWWGSVALALTAALALPAVASPFALLQISVIAILSLLGISEGFLWGFAGILSFGQTAFFGLGGYVYAIGALNLDHTILPLIAAVILPALLAALLSYFMIYGRIGDVYLSVITLVVTLIFEKAIRATSGDQFVIGDVRLGGQNGIPSVPPLALPWNADVTLGLTGVFYLSVICLALVYIGLQLLLHRSWGRVLVSIRESEARAQLLGYDTRAFKIQAFVIAGAIAGFSGALYAVWGNFVAPEMFSLGQSAQILIWVIVGGRRSLVGPIIGCGLIQYLTAALGTAAVGQVTVVLGFILMVAVLVFPGGILQGVADAGQALRRLALGPGRAR